MRYVNCNMCFTILTSFIIFAFLIGCNQDVNLEDEQLQFSVMYPTQYDFLVKYGNRYLIEYPEAAIDVLATEGIYQYGKDRNEATTQFINENKLDVLVLTMDQYKQYEESGQLYRLDSFIQRDQFDLDELHAGAIEWLKNEGNRGIYGLAPFFSTNALYYNMDLFDQYNIPYPHDQMTWEEVIELAMQFSMVDDVYGFKHLHGSSPYELVVDIAETNGMKIYDEMEERFSANTEPWYRLLQMVEIALQSNSLYLEQFYEQPNDASHEDPFMDGVVAIQYFGTHYYYRLMQAQHTLLGEIPRWDVVTQPIDSGSPDQTNFYQLNEIFAISADSLHVEAAWNFIKFIHGDTFDYRQAPEAKNHFYVRKKKHLDSDHNVDAFYKLMFAPDSNDVIPSTIVSPYAEQLILYMREKMEETLLGDKSIEETLIDIEKEGDRLISESKD